MDEPVPIHGHGDGRVFTVGSMCYGKHPLTWSLPQVCKQVELGAVGGLLGDPGFLGLYVGLPGWGVLSSNLGLLTIQGREILNSQQRRVREARPACGSCVPSRASTGLEATKSAGRKGHLILFFTALLLCSSLGVSHPSRVPHTPVLGPLHSRGWISH